MTAASFPAKLSAVSPKNGRSLLRPGKRLFPFFLVRVLRDSEILHRIVLLCLSRLSIRRLYVRVALVPASERQVGSNELLGLLSRLLGMLNLFVDVLTQSGRGSGVHVVLFHKRVQFPLQVQGIQRELVKQLADRRAVGFRRSRCIFSDHALMIGKNCVEEILVA